LKQTVCPTAEKFMSLPVTRRELLKTTGLAAAATLLTGRPSPAMAAEPPATQPTTPRTPVLRIAHLTDIHVQPERRAAEGLAACLRHVQSQPDQPDLILTGGDLVMDSFEASFDRTKLQWDVFAGVFKDECSLPVEHCLGNHDIWGWNRKKSGATGDEPRYGKKWALEVLGLESPYRSFARAGWHFIVLDSVSPQGDGYVGKLDADQMEWLRAELARVPVTTPVLVLSHIPIFAACVLDDPKGKAEQDGEWRVPASLMLADSHKIRTLFAERGNVRLCLSGHIHRVDRVDFGGVSYVCDGAVSGAWWRGPHYDCREGYGRIDLFADGTWNHRYVTYGWQAEAAG
jgi:3',5'-cyclic AMP phosphodiesterase CpdA